MTQGLFRFEIPEGILYVKTMDFEDDPIILEAWLNGDPISDMQAERYWNIYRLQRRIRARL